MSALPPKADIRRHEYDVRFVSKADICAAAKKWLFDHLVGAGEERRGHCYADRSGGFEIDD
jgi:hypothetical protein